MSNQRSMFFSEVDCFSWFLPYIIFWNNSLWDFIFYPSIVDCWRVRLSWLDQCSFILILDLRCDCKLSVGRTIIGYMYFLPLQAWGRPWQGSLVGCNFLLIPIDCFTWSKISFNFVDQEFICWFLTFVFLIYWISAHWYWNFPWV